MKLVFYTLFVFIFFSGYTGYQFFKLNPDKMTVVFCDVGQGDAVLFRTPKGKKILFDGGPDKSVLDCLSRNLPFWERTLDVLILSHPHADHLNGLIEVLQRYKVKAFATEEVANSTTGYNTLKEELKKKSINTSFLSQNDVVKTADGVRFSVLSPTTKFVKETTVNGLIRESGEFASLIVLVSYRNFDLLLTGDTQVAQFTEAVQRGLPSQLEILQVPHHGSRFGLSTEVLEKIRPDLAVISVGKNSYGHPSPLTLNLLSQQRIKIERTDKRGSVAIVSDGDTYSIR